MAIQDYKEVSKHKLQANAALIPKEWVLAAEYLKNVNAESDLNVLDVPSKCGILSEKELELTGNYDATALLEKIAGKEVSSYEVVLAFCKRAAIAQQLTNCLTEIMFEEALIRAKQCDEYLAKNGKVMGPLHGLPISLKDSFNVKGYQTTIGFVSFASHPPAVINSVLVEILIKNGMVCYCKSNLPQSMMSADSDNNLFGRTLNPNKLSLTAGGSTGGEGALIKMRGSVLGIGTDIAGSVRIPALCDGIFGFKPTVGRIPFAGKVPPGRLGSPGQIAPVIGPEGHSVRDMELFMRVVIDAEPWELDEGTIAIPWRRLQPITRKLRLGLILEDAKRPLHPPMLRTMKAAAKELEASGHTIVPMDDKIPSIWESSILAWKYFLLDPKKTPLKHIKAAEEPIVKSLHACFYDELKGWEPSLDELWDMNVQRRKTMKVYHDIIVQNQLDGFIMPPYQATAQPHDLYGVPPYTVIPNLLDYPAASIPYLEANKGLDKEFIRDGIAYEPPYHADAVEGAPSGIQVVGKPMKDEELIQIMSIVADVLKAKS
ncbi:amidase [Rhizodiscina lignyota]|uniref:Amidase n=1 Tax=Rhizodiscina lignyota TaxID=1504668 RepID=A0A9P4MF30_9PEZI|nr:amidase [Rhizodiscina lignyota]